MEAQHDSARISNKVGTMWLWTINIQQWHGHSGGICLLGPPPFLPPFTAACLILLSPLPSLLLHPSLRWGCAALQYDTQFGERQLNWCQQTHAALAISISEE